MQICSDISERMNQKFWVFMQMYFTIDISDFDCYEGFIVILENHLSILLNSQWKKKILTLITRLMRTIVENKLIV